MTRRPHQPPGVSGGFVYRNSVGIMILAALTGAARVPALRAQTRDNLPVVTLDEARRRALTVDPASVAARSETGAAGWERRAARLGLFTPDVTVGGSFVHYSEPFFNLGTGGVTANTTNATIDARYSVVGAGKFAELKRAGA